MKQPQDLVLSNSDVNDEPVFDADELNTIVKYLDALMEVDFEQNSNKGLVASVS